VSRLSRDKKESWCPTAKKKEAPGLDGGDLMHMEIDRRNHGAFEAGLPGMRAFAPSENSDKNMCPFCFSCAGVVFPIRSVAPSLCRDYPDALESRGAFAASQCDARIPDDCLAGWSLVGCSSI